MGTAGFHGFLGGREEIKEVYYYEGGHSAPVARGNVESLVDYTLTGRPTFPLASTTTPRAQFVSRLSESTIVGLAHIRSALRRCGWCHVGPFQRADAGDFVVVALGDRHRGLGGPCQLLPGQAGTTHRSKPAQSRERRNTGNRDASHHLASHPLSMHCLGGLRSTAAEPPFTLKQVGPNAWAAIDNPKATSPAAANAGFVIGDDGVVVIDTFSPRTRRSNSSPRFSRTKLPVKYVVNTHYHIDHVAGNGVFAKQGATVLARNVRGWIHTENLRLIGDFLTPELKAQTESFAAPTVDYEDASHLYLGSRAIHVRSLPGHTGGDSIVDRSRCQGRVPRRPLLAQHAAHSDRRIDKAVGRDAGCYHGHERARLHVRSRAWSPAT